MRVEYISPFLASTMKVLQTMAQTEAKPGKPYKKEGNEASGVISAVIDLEGGTQGSICLTFTEPCIVGIVNNMLGESFTELTEEVADAVGELTNMISGEARRNLAEAGFVFTAGIPQVTQGEAHTIQHAADGPVAVIPFKTVDGVFTVEACFESEKFFDDMVKSHKQVEIAESNSSVLVLTLESFLGATPTPFKSFALKPNSQVMKPNFFLIPEYIQPQENYEFCNFTTLEVHVCPDTLFASNVLNSFKYSQNPTHPVLENPELQAALIPSLVDMKEMLGSMPASMYSLKRTVENGVLSYQLAMRTSELLYHHDSSKFGGELNKVGEYALKAALLSKIEKSMTREKEFLDLALGSYKKILPSATGENFFRCCFRVVALSVYLKEYTVAKSSVATMVKFYQQYGSQLDADSIPRIKRYIQLVDKIYKTKEDFSMEKHQDRTDYQFLD